MSFKPINLAQFTHWGIYLTIVYCSLATVHEARLRIQGTAYSELPWSQDKSAFCLWKWTSFFFETAFVFENLIVLFYWTCLYPGIDFSTKTHFEIACNYIDHIVPLAVLLVDMACNRYPFNRKHLWVLVPFMILYGVDNITVSLIRGIPIYKPLDPKNPLSYLVALALPLLTCLIFLAWERFVAWKLRKYAGKDERLLK